MSDPTLFDIDFKNKWLGSGLPLKPFIDIYVFWMRILKRGRQVRDDESLVISVHLYNYENIDQNKS